MESAFETEKRPSELRSRDRTKGFFESLHFSLWIPNMMNERYNEFMEHGRVIWHLLFVLNLRFLICCWKATNYWHEHSPLFLPKFSSSLAEVSENPPSMVYLNFYVNAVPFLDISINWQKKILRIWLYYKIKKVRPMKKRFYRPKYERILHQISSR